jgi:D-3-phosphoglycerate dehydrogenase / 2-oxoglutarate reductase
VSPRFRVLVADKLALEGLAPLRRSGSFELVERHGLTGDELATALAEVDAVIVRSSTRITREVLARAVRLQVIGRAGVGVDNIDVAAATERGIAVLNAPAGNTISAAELTLALLLAVVRRVPAADRSMKAGEWRRTFSGTELFGKTLGLVGAGRIGGEVARRARAFGMGVIIHDPFLTEERALALQAQRVALDELLRTADVVSIHVPLTESTTGLIGEPELRLMKPGAYLVNAARGGVLDEAALYRVLKDGHLAGAALDVYEREPVPQDHPLRTLENVVLTPHLGAATAEAQQNVAVEIGEAVRAALEEGDYSRAVNAPAIGGDEMRRLRPLMALSQQLGRLACALREGPVHRVTVRYAGEMETALWPLVASALAGLLEDVVGRGAVNYVNALHLAESRGIRVERIGEGPGTAYNEYVSVRAEGSEGEICVAGALLSEAHPRVVRIGGFHVDLVPEGFIVILRNRDVPGVIGRVGTVLGEAGVNIGEYSQARVEAGGEALAAIRVDSRLPAETVARLREVPEVTEVRQVLLD